MNSLTIEDIQKWFECLSEKSLAGISEIYSKDCFFKDPFNEIVGSDRLARLFSHMFNKLENPHFVFIDLIDKDEQFFLTWDFIFKKSGKEFRIHGSSHLKIKDDKVFYHRDYWDVGEEILLKVPVVKNIYGVLVNSLKVE